MLFYCFPRSGSLLTLNVRLQTAAETKPALPSSKMWEYLENTVYLLATYFNLEAVKNMGGIKNVYWWKVTYSIFYITHGQTPCLQWSVVYRQSGWQWPDLYKGSKPTATASVLAVSLHRAANSSNSPALMQLWSSCPAGWLTTAPWLPGQHPCVGVLNNFLHMVFSVMLHLCQFLSSSTVVLLSDKPELKTEFLMGCSNSKKLASLLLWLAIDDIRIKKISVQPSPLEGQVGSPITSTPFPKSRRYYNELRII